MRVIIAAIIRANACLRSPSTTSASDSATSASSRTSVCESRTASCSSWSAVRLRQIDHPAHGGGTRGGQRGHDPHRRPGHHAPAAARARRRDGVPGLRALSAPDACARTSRFGAAAQEVPASRDRSTRRRGRRDARARAAARSQAEAAVRRPAAAGRDGPRDGARAAGVPVRRAAVESRRRACARRCASRSAACSGGSKTTTIYVTHDQVEAMTLGDRIVVLADGRHPAGRPADRAVPRVRSTASSPGSSAARR